MAKIPTQKQVSAGGVTYRNDQESLEVAIVLVGKKRRWQLPKGLIGEGEAIEAAALREVREETGIQSKLIAPIETIEYWYVAKQKGIPVRFHKFVHFFLMEGESGDVSQHDHEVIESRWVAIEEAIQLLAFKGEKEVVKKANEMLQQPLLPFPKATLSPAAPLSSNGLSLVSWNVNGMRAILKKGFLEWFHKTQPDILCLQETKCSVDQLPLSIQQLEDYHTYWAVAQKSGYAGTAIFTKLEPISVHIGMGIEEFDAEGRTIAVEYEQFVIINGYFPNGGAYLKRVEYKLGFKKAFLKYCEQWRQQKSVIFCGDLNTAHHAIDIARPKSKKNKSGFLDKERNWIDQVLDLGYIDTFRKTYPQKTGVFTCWPYSRNSRERNIGWRLDYIFVDSQLEKKVQQATVHTHVSGSDHCPVSINLEFFQ